MADLADDEGAAELANAPPAPLANSNSLLYHDENISYSQQHMSLSPADLESMGDVKAEMMADNAAAANATVQESGSMAPAWNMSNVDESGRDDTKESLVALTQPPPLPQSLLPPPPTSAAAAASASTGELLGPRGGPGADPEAAAAPVTSHIGSRTADLLADRDDSSMIDNESSDVDGRPPERYIVFHCIIPAP
jgi:hypothetical protein